MKRDEGSPFAISISPPAGDRFRQESTYRQSVALPVRVEKCGKSALDGWELSVAVNSIRSNTVEEARSARPSPRRWLERGGNAASR